MRSGRADIGALVSFSGLVRDLDGSLNALNLEHYPGMTEAALTDIASQAMERWEHRAEAFQAADFMMDFLKSRAPFWKKEEGADGAKWVDARDVDEQSLSRWGNKG